MKKIILFLIFIFYLHAKTLVALSIPPLEYFLKEIAGKNVDAFVVVKPGFSPATYEPKPSDLKKIAKANLYFAIGVPFEKSYLKRFKNVNKNLKIIFLQKGANFITLSKKGGKKGKGIDPHIWLSPKEVKNTILKNILNAFIAQDKQNEKLYTKNYLLAIKKINKLENKIKIILQNVKNKNFAVFHPQWGYFARDYSFVQIPIESEGKDPSIKEMIRVIKTIKKKKIKTIFIQPEFSSKMANLIAKETKAKVVPISALDKKWDQVLLKFAKALSESN